MLTDPTFEPLLPRLPAGQFFTGKKGKRNTFSVQKYRKKGLQILS